MRGEIAAKNRTLEDLETGMSQIFEIVPDLVIEMPRGVESLRSLVLKLKQDGESMD